MNESERQARRKKRRKRRLIAIASFIVFVTGIAWFFELQDTTTVIVVPYADVASLGGDDPGLSPNGKSRAEELARVLGDIDVVDGVDVIFVSKNRRSRDTSVPISLRNDAPVHTIDDPDDEDSLVKRILTEFKGDIVLVVIEPEYIKPLIREMQGSKKVKRVEQLTYDNLYVVTIPWFGKVKTLRFRYGAVYTLAPESEA